MFWRHVERPSYARFNEQSHVAKLHYLVTLLGCIGKSSFDPTPESVDADFRLGVESPSGVVGSLQNFFRCFADFDRHPRIMKKIGITGPPGSGKTTLWRAITGGVAQGDAAVISVPDERLDTLVRLHSSTKRVQIQIELVDAHASRSSAQALGRLREMDAIVAVAPEFSGGGAELDDLILADLEVVETRLRSAKKEPQSSQEAATLEGAMQMLSDGRPLREGEWQARDLAAFMHLAPLTLKPILVVRNVAEDAVVAGGSDAISARIEAEVAGLAPDEAAELLAGYGIEAPAADRLIAAIFGLLDLITFYTINEKEVRAWELRRGATAPQAAGTVHSDMERGFIRAEVAGYDQVVEAGSWDAARAANFVKVEGKDYVVRDGDVVKIRFSV